MRHKNVTIEREIPKWKKKRFKYKDKSDEKRKETS